MNGENLKLVLDNKTITASIQSKKVTKKLSISRFKPKKIPQNSVDKDSDSIYDFEVKDKFRTIGKDIDDKTDLYPFIDGPKTVNVINDSKKLELNENDMKKNFSETSKNTINKIEEDHSSEYINQQDDKEVIINIIEPELISQLQPQLQNKKRFLGEGGASKVYKVNCINKNNEFDENSKTFYALKILKMNLFEQPHHDNIKNLSKWSDNDDDDDNDDEDDVIKHDEEEDEIILDMNKIKNFFQEFEILHNLNHPNIIHTFGFFFGDNKYPPSILLEYFKHNLNNSIKILKDIHLIGIIHELSEVMNFIHQKGIIHRDLKPSNILLDNHKHVKLCDFGISKLISTDTQTTAQTNTAGAGTILFMAPEIVQAGGNYDEKVDVFSFGIVVHFILSRGDVPSFNYEDAIKLKKVKMSDKINKISQTLINRCLSFFPKERPNFEEIVDFLNENEMKMIDGIEDQIEILNAYLKYE